MRHSYGRIVTAAGAAVLGGLMVLGTSTAARADENRIEAKVPFPFIVGHERVPAGTYIVQEEDDTPGVVSVESADGRQFVFTMSEPEAAPAIRDRAAERPTLEFQKVGNQYFLASVTLAGGDEREIVLTPGAMERTLVGLGRTS